MKKLFIKVFSFFSVPKMLFKSDFVVLSQPAIQGASTKRFHPSPSKYCAAICASDCFLFGVGTELHRAKFPPFKTIQKDYERCICVWWAGGAGELPQSVQEGQDRPQQGEDWPHQVALGYCGSFRTRKLGNLLTCTYMYNVEMDL